MNRSVLGAAITAAALLGGVTLAGPAASTELCNPSALTGSTAYACGSLNYPADANGAPTGAPDSGSLIVSSAGEPMGGNVTISGDGAPSLTVSGQGNTGNPPPADGSASVTVDQGGVHTG